MALGRPVDPLNPAASLGPRRLGQGSPGGIRAIQRNLIDPLNPAASLPRLQPIKIGQRQIDQLARGPNSGRISDIINDARTNSLRVGGDARNPEFTDEQVRSLRALGVSDALMPSMVEVLRGKRQFGTTRHRSILSEIGTVLGAIEASGAGFAKGTEAYQKQHGYKGRLLDYLSHPSRLYKELGAGFSEVPDAVSEGYTYQDFIKESTKPGSLLNKYSLPIGLGMSVLFDPTTYLTFGATSASKTAAYHILAETDKRAALAADKLIKGNYGKIIDTVHGPVRADWAHLDEITSHVKVSSGSPFTLGDALDQLKRQGQLTKDTIRRTGEYIDPRTGQLTKAGVRQRIAAVALPHNVKGGRGVRFMGASIPGTPALGQKLAGAGKNVREGSKAIGGAGEALIPEWGARHVADDAVRASALVEMARFRTRVSQAQSEIAHTVREMQRPRVLATEDDILHGVVEEGTKFKRVLVRPEARRGILEAADDTLDPAQRSLKAGINVDAETYIKNASAAGLSEKTMRKLWNDLTDYYDDPLLALAEFKFKATARQMGHQFVDNVLRDRRFAIPMVEKEAAKYGDVFRAPKGYTEFHFGQKRYAVRNSIIDGVKDLTNPARIDGNLQRGFRKLNMVQDWWKLYATSPNPAFHVMNFLGAVWNNALAGVYNPADYFDALRTLYRGRKEEAAQVGSKFGLTRRVPESTPAGREAQALLGEAEARSGLGRSSFLFGDISRGHYSAEQLAMSDQPIAENAPLFQRTASEAMESGRNVIGRVTKPPPGVSKKRFYGVTTPRRAAGVALAATGNPIAFAAFMPEMARVGRRVGGTIEDLVRLTPFMKYGNDPAVASVLREFGPINSSMKIVYPRFTKQDQQIMYDIGAHISRQFQFDYTNLTPFERYVAKSIFPFWTYYKNNIALQVQQVAKRPMLFGTALKTMNYINENGENYQLGPWKEILPAYFENLQAFQIPVPNHLRSAMGLPKDQPLYLNPKLPFMSINLIPNFYEILRDPNMATTQKLREIVAPVAGSWGPLSPFPLGPGSKILLEAGTGYNLGLNRPIDFSRLESGDMRHGYTTAPSWLNMLPHDLGKKFFGAFEDPKTGKLMISHTSSYVLEQLSTPFINNLGSAIPIQGATESDRERQRANLVSWMSGIRLMPVDVLRLDRNAAYDTLNRLEAKQTDLRYRGETLSPDEETELRLLRAHLKVIELAWDEREGTLPGG